MAWRALTVFAAVAAPWVSGCLPQDTRPPPGELLVTATSDDALAQGFISDDGWSVGFDRVLIAVGHASVEGDECIGYSDPDYGRLLEMTRTGSQKVSVAFALGQCEFDWELSTPNEDAVLGAGVTEADRTLMRTPGDDAYAKNSGLSIYLDGAGTKNGVTKRFAWSYRHRIDSATCKATVDGVVREGVKLTENGSTTVDLTVGGATPFRSRYLDGPSATAFEPFANADVNDDGIISLEELGAVELSGLSGFDDGSEKWETLADFLYLGQFRKFIRYRGNGTCEQEVFPNDRTPR